MSTSEMAGCPIRRCPNDSPTSGSRVPRIATALYGTFCYAIFLGVFIYAIGFVADVGVPRGIDSAVRATPMQALVIDFGLLTLFALQHSVMARPVFKRWWTRYVPPPVERSTYVLFASACLALLFWQ
jgi:protein-S-isoprenylcysteine O-methyltransferase Ste14